MRIRHRALFALLLLPAAAHAQAGGYTLSPTPAAWSSRVAAARAVLVDSMRKADIPGVSITVVKDGRIIWSEGLGYADLEQRVPATPLTRFRIGSISKSLTAGAVGQLWEPGPARPRRTGAALRPVLSRQAMADHHAGGCRAPGRYPPLQGDAEIYGATHYRVRDPGLRIFADSHPLSSRARGSTTASYGFSLLSAVMEGASGEPFLRLCASTSFFALGMIHTVAEFPDSLSRTARGSIPGIPPARR